jgi:O-succinylbenzoate synthase
MRPERIVLRLVRARLSVPFENRWQRFETWTKLLVRVDAGGLSGYGECTAMETPFYNYETVETAWHILARYLAPAALHGTEDLVNGHEEAKGALECALWDLRARASGVPLCEYLGGSRRAVPAAATVGIEPTVDALVAAVDRARAAGYGRVRIKIRPGWDVEPLRAVRADLPDVPVYADANGAYRAEHLGHLRGLAALGLAVLEQPFPAHALELTAQLQHGLPVPICLDESVKGLADLERALRLGAGRIVNIKVGRVGGLAEAIRIHDRCRESAIATFVGAKYELGLGRWTNLALATLPNMTLPSDVGPSARYYHHDGADRGVEFSAPGQVWPLAAPGLGAVPIDSVETVRELALTPRLSPVR